jgi:hypothetical protein
LAQFSSVYEVKVGAALPVKSWVYVLLKQPNSKNSVPVAGAITETGCTGNGLAVSRVYVPAYVAGAIAEGPDVSEAGTFPHVNPVRRLVVFSRIP